MMEKKNTHTQMSMMKILTASFKNLHECAVTIVNEISCQRCTHSPPPPKKKKEGAQEKEQEDILSKCSIFMLE
jgi:hypothetical protein